MPARASASGSGAVSDSRWWQCGEPTAGPKHDRCFPTCEIETEHGRGRRDDVGDAAQLALHEHMRDGYGAKCDPGDEKRVAHADHEGALKRLRRESRQGAWEAESRTLRAHATQLSRHAPFAAGVCRPRVAAQLRLRDKCLQARGRGNDGTVSQAVPPSAALFSRLT